MALNYQRMPGPGDLPGDNTNPNSPDFDHEAADAAIDAKFEDIDLMAEVATELAGWTMEVTCRDAITSLIDLHHRGIALPSPLSHIAASLHQGAIDELEGRNAA